MSRITVSVIGAGGKMGTRTSNNLALKPDGFKLMMVEASEAGIKSIRDRGFVPVSVEEALEQSDVVVFAVPDTLIKKLSAVYVPKLRPGTGFIILDPAAAVARELTLRDDCTFAVAHPCHPSYFIDQDTYEARQDRFGGCGGKQDIVMSKIQGDDNRFEQCVEVAKQMYAPVEHAYVMTSEQIAFLEPTLVELLGATCLYAMAETVDEAERRGIDRDAAVSFLTGHIYNLSANFLGYIPGKPPVSDACKVAIGLGNRLVMREDWKQIWDDGILDKVIATMLHPENPQI
ncbi:phosphogluconate dehydrogenase C-terminal domain-containing protein [Enterocloster aldenensis]|uniref:phosphogluconate dehydrogenase C-terminal domain-containing protein n=1 Tax=Enterocloster aldenensis TaxID=358742 RepID=UPI000E4A3353|nr:F420-dependent NADP oxidoreductase [Enterocloster aldenensis]